MRHWIDVKRAVMVVIGFVTERVKMIKVKVINEFLGVPRDAIGEVLEGPEFPMTGSRFLKFGERTVHAQWPMDSHYRVIPDDSK